jgi:hypothetical protein|tara:strand:+ start:3741 stop:3917 length:177 start_codon:yes stop_codon:yes gene_type:complete
MLMQNTYKIEQLKLIFRLKLILSEVKKDLKEVERYKRIINSLDFLEKEMEKYNPVGDK